MTILFSLLNSLNPRTKRASTVRFSAFKSGAKIRTFSHLAKFFCIFLFFDPRSPCPEAGIRLCRATRTRSIRTPLPRNAVWHPRGLPVHTPSPPRRRTVAARLIYDFGTSLVRTNPGPRQCQQGFLRGSFSEHAVFHPFATRAGDRFHSCHSQRHPRLPSGGTGLVVLHNGATHAWHDRIIRTPTRQNGHRNKTVATASAK